MANKLTHDKSGNVSSKRVIMLSAAAVMVILALPMGAAYIYGQVFQEKTYDVAGIIAITGMLGSLITLLAGLSLGEKKDK